MYNVVIFSGGTGSIAIQEGFHKLYGDDNYNLDIIINAYDNGKSTGICRKVFNSKILGPSDLRKNHMTQYRLRYASELNNSNSRESEIYRLFNLRMTADSKEDFYNETCALLEKSRKVVGEKDAQYLKSLVDYFFYEDFQNKKWRRTLQGVKFDNFSLANIFYSSAAALNEYSMRMAGRDMAVFLQIKDNVHLISDVNLFLQAQTESGYVIRDEGEIVKWNNPNDKIVAVSLLKDGKEYIPFVDEGTDITQIRSVNSIVNFADIVIFSSGTQWSSLIPTYMHSGLRKILSSIGAKKYIIMNNTEDCDMKGVCADDTIKLLKNYIPMDGVTAIINLDAAPSMKHVQFVRNIKGHIGGKEDKHDPEKLVALLMRDFFNLPAEKLTFIYDLDGTLWDERSNNKGKEVGIENIILFHGIIHSGNTYQHVRNVFKYLYHQDKEVEIYSDFGNIHFTSKNYHFDMLSEAYKIEPQIIEELEKIDKLKGKIKNRGEGCVITIKPIMNREQVLEQIKESLNPWNGIYVAYISGHTSIDIMHKEYDKKTMLREIIKRNNLKIDKVVFVGNEVAKGAEENIKELGVKTIQVNDVFECNMLIKTINFHGSKGILNET